MKDKLRKLVRETVQKQFKSLEEDVIDEERISNIAANKKVKGKENFIGSHTYGEDLGGLGRMYVAYSYGEQHPLYVFSNDKWYVNTDDYILDDGTINTWTKKHLKDLKPSDDLKPRTGAWIKKLIHKFKFDNGIGTNTHADLEPGEK